jgi:predicted  nucleic acid-binding Zn-ribbon protein
LYRQKLANSEIQNKSLRVENLTLHEELQDIRREMEELQDQFRLDDADEFRQLQAELEIAAKNCRILQFKLRKLEKRNENLENDKMILTGREFVFIITVI